ncbi:tRNA lysidine(34) synthetase TilS [Thalassotalea piscium]
MQLISIQRALKEQLQCYPTKNLVIACSGGVDSLVLLYEVASLVKAKVIKNKITVCYVNHGLSEHAVTWHNFVQQHCHKLSLAFIGKRVHIDKNANQSLEAQARDARYRALYDVAGNKGIVITAHHQDDQIETFFLALKRGSGLKGLSSMSTYGSLQTESGSLALLRPLLTISRQCIEDRAKALSLEWVEDESNLDQQFDRNFLRQTIIPMLAQRWPGIGQSIARTTEHCQDAQQLIDDVASNDLHQCLNQDNELDVKKLLTLSSSRFNYVIRYYLNQHHQLMPSSQVLAQVKKQLSASGDKTPQVKVGNKWFRRFQNKLMLTDDFADLSSWQGIVDIAKLKQAPLLILLPDNVGKLSLSISNSDEAKLPADNITCLFIPDKIEQLSIQFNHNNPTCLPDYRQHSRSLKKIFQELKIAPWQRKRVPLIFEQETLIAALGQFTCQPYTAKCAGTDGIIKLNVHWLASDNSG